jgi:RNA polymerase sigma factor (sigma-70 family)
MSDTPTRSKTLDRDTAAARALTLAKRTAVAMLGPGEDARDVAQEVAMRVVQRRSQLRDADKFDAWVHRIAVREAFRAQRDRSRRRNVEGELDARALELPGPHADPAALATADGAAHAAMAQLGDRERAAMILRYVHDLPDSQIAAILDCPRGTVNSLLSRARARLRALPELEVLATTFRGEQ